jgi:UDP-glucose 4-epimerase
MGISKAMMEKVFVAKAKRVKKTVICGTRYGNVMYSRGSVIPLFVSQLLAEKPVTVTDPGMTRFLMSLADSVELVLHAFSEGRPGDLFVRKSPAATVGTLVEALGVLLNRKPDIESIGVRHGEKAHETLLGEEERRVAEDQGAYYRVPVDSRTLNYSIYTQEGQESARPVEAFTSENTERLEVEEVVQLLRTLPEIQDVLAGLK